MLSEGGALAGQVIDVGDGWASVMLISDTRSLRDRAGQPHARDGRGDGPALGATGHVQHPASPTRSPSTTAIVTAGIDLGKRFRSLFPKNIPIGRVVDVQQEPGSIVQTALVQPAADLDRIEDVLVLTDLRLPQRSDTDIPGEHRSNLRSRPTSGTRRP